jgi:hypothetical protein
MPSSCQLFKGQIPNGNPYYVQQQLSGAVYTFEISMHCWCILLYCNKLLRSNRSRLSRRLDWLSCNNMLLTAMHPISLQHQCIYTKIVLFLALHNTSPVTNCSADWLKTDCYSSAKIVDDTTTQFSNLTQICVISSGASGWCVMVER